MSVQVIADGVRGHIAIVADGEGAAAFTDLGGGELHLWAFTAATLGPTDARDLAAALEAWADRTEAGS